jgi:hypothetical protein
MGLDIYHFRAQDPAATMPTSVREFLAADAALQKLSAFATKKTNKYLDWPATFAKVNQPFEHYAHGTWGSSKDGMYHGFSRKEGAPPHLPERLEFRYGRTENDLGDLVIGDREDTIIFADEAGYQGKLVRSAFFHEFQAREYITDRERVEHIHAMTLPEHQQHFQKAFLDNWDDERSFVVVSY